MNMVRIYNGMFVGTKQINFRFLVAQKIIYVFEKWKHCALQHYMKQIIDLNNKNRKMCISDGTIINNTFDFVHAISIYNMPTGFGRTMPSSGKIPCV